jgi:hypothetical protein
LGNLAVVPIAYLSLLIAIGLVVVMVFIDPPHNVKIDGHVGGRGEAELKSPDGFDRKENPTPSAVIG